MQIVEDKPETTFNWSRLYWLLFGFLVLQIVAYYWLTQALQVL